MSSVSHALLTLCLGSLSDKTLRLDIQNPIFKRLQDAILHQSRSKEWFGMAEQAINTIYNLSEHPDILCNDLIKDLARRAFGPKEKSAETEEARAKTPMPDAMDEDTPSVADETATAPMQSARSSARAFPMRSLIPRKKSAGVAMNTGKARHRKHTHLS